MRYTYIDNNDTVKVGTLEKIKLELISDLSTFIYQNQDFEHDKDAVSNAIELSEDIHKIVHADTKGDLNCVAVKYGYLIN